MDFNFFKSTIYHCFKPHDGDSNGAKYYGSYVSWEKSKTALAKKLNISQGRLWIN